MYNSGVTSVVGDADSAATKALSQPESGGVIQG